MALLPQIALQGVIPQVPPVDVGALLLRAAQIHGMQQQGQLRDLALSDALLQQRQRRTAEEYIASQLAQQGLPAATPLGRLVPPALPDESYVLHPQASPRAATQALSPATQALPGTTYDRAPDVMQAPAVRRDAQAPAARPSQRPSAAGLDWREVYKRGGMQGLEMLNALHAYETGDQQRQLVIQHKGLEFLTKLSSVITDQASLDAANAQLQQLPLAPGLKNLLPKTYSPEAMTTLRQAMMPLKDQLDAHMDRAKLDLEAAKLGITAADLQLRRQRDERLDTHERHRLGLQERDVVTRETEQRMKERQAGSKVPDYGLGTDLNAQVYADWGPDLAEVGSRPTPAMVEQSRQRAEQIRTRQSALQGTAKPLDDTGRRTLSILLTAEDVTRALLTEFTPDERARYVGLGGLKMTAERAKAMLEELQMGKASDPKFARFVGLVGLTAREAFATTGSTLTGNEKENAFAFLPTGKEWTIEEFEQKLALSNARIPGIIDHHLTLAATPASELKEQRRQGALSSNVAQAPRTLSQAQVRELATQYRVSEDEVLQRARTSGYRITP